EIFAREAVEAIHTRSSGIPRTISVICDNALIAGFASDRRPVDRETVLEVCRELDLGRIEPITATRLPSVASPAAARRPSVPAGDSDVPAPVALHVNPALSGRLVVSGELKSVTVEQYRRLAATLHHSQCDNGTKVVMVASAVAGEGKTVTAVNLALTLSESY